MASMECGDQSSRNEILLALAAYLLVVAGLGVLLPLLSGTLWRVLVALLVVIPLGLNVWVSVRHYRRLDELEQRIQLTALAVAFAGTFVVTTLYGVMQDQIGLPLINWVWVGTFMNLSWIVSTVVASRRYR